MILFIAICILATSNGKLQNAIVNECQVYLNRYALNIEILVISTYSILLREVVIKIIECRNSIIITRLDIINS